MNSYDTYYPRPLLQRDSFLSLNGEWELNKNKVNIPFPPESNASNYEGTFDKLEYTKSFELPDNFYNESQKVILHFGAVDQICDVYLNSTFLLHHEGGYLPFEINITDYLSDTNKLTVICKDNLNKNYPYGKQCKKPHGMWYTPVSGIWQSVWLEAYDKNGIDNISIETTMDTLKLHIESNSNYFNVRINNITNTYNNKNIEIKIDNPHLWNTEDPYLYDLEISTENDSVRSYFGLREFKMIDNKFYLNNKPLFICGLLDQGYYEEGIFTPIDVKEYENDILNMKELGFNCLRKHIKIEPEAFYYYCDKHGMLVMQDMVNSGRYSFFIDTVISHFDITKLPKPLINKKRYDFFISHSKETINHLKSHTSIFAYTIYNEGWGQQSADKAYEELKPNDPNRFFDATSGWYFENKSDFESYHVYFKNKALKSSNKPLLLSECGGFIRDIKEHKSEKGTKWGYGETDSEESLTNKIIEMHDLMVIPSIKNGLIGYIFTQVSDVEGEINGLYTYDRKICKVNKEKIRQANLYLQDLYKHQFNS